MRDALEAVYLFLPAGIANLTPPLLTRFLGAGRPIDGGLLWRGRPIFGAHKTWQGLIGGTCAGVLTFIVQRMADGRAIPIAFAVAISFGALAGDVVKSFAKRRVAVEPGRSWIPFDQLDYVIGALVAGAFFLPLTLTAVAAVIVVYFALHFAVSAIGFVLGVKAAPI